MIISSLNLKARSFRLLYVIVSSLGLIGVLFFYATNKTDLLFYPNGFSKFIALVFATWGLIVMKLSFRNYPMKAFIGLEEEGEGSFATAGLLKLVRHPLYSGMILLFFGFFLFDPNWNSLITFVILLGYLQIGIKLEEDKLIQKFGKKYLDYKEETPKLIPEFWK